MIYSIAAAFVFGTITIVTGQSGYPSARLPTSNSQNPPSQYETQQKKSPGFGQQGGSPPSGFGVPNMPSGYGSQSMQPPRMGGQSMPPSMGGQNMPPNMGGQSMPPSMGGQSMSSGGSFPDFNALAMLAGRGGGRGGGGGGGGSSSGLGGLFGSLFGGMGGGAGGMGGGAGGLGLNSLFLYNPEFMQDLMSCRMMMQMANMKFNPQQCALMISQGML